MTADSDRKVQTGELRKIIKGREEEILDRLGIPFRAGNPHIHCPYPDHPDKHPSFRFDCQKKCAYCTCIPTRPGGTRAHDIFGIVMCLERISFEAAKLRIAEIIGRHDLIRTQGAGPHYQRTDAARLLNPPADNRNDELPYGYLAARLGIDIAAVPRPTTPVVGYKSLAYFDPPASERAKPKPVAYRPCAVFGTVAADGRQHAHRIYLTPDGRGKADLGIDPKGQARDPKKSAKLIDGQASTAGIWGNPKRTAHLVLLEGIENAAAGAYALRPEIEADEICVKSAITAPGVEAFAPWPATKTVTVAADRDDAKKGERYQRGEHAARTFALRNRDRVEVRIGLPGKPGESTDWLEVLLRDGVEAVRQGILGATPFIPTQDEIENSRREKTQAQHAKAIAETYPLPPLETLRLEYRRTKGGEIWVHKFVGEKIDTASGEEVAVWTPVSSPFGVSALLRMADADDAYGLRVSLQDMSGQPRAIDLDRAELARLGASEIRARLLEAGLRVEGDGESVVVQVLKAAKPSGCIIVVSRPGWHRSPNPVFVTPAGETIGAPEGVRIELAASVKLPERVSRSGTIEGWQAAVRTAATAENCPHWTLSAAAGFCGVLVDLIKFDTCGLSQSGDTSLGKTTGQQIAVSAWSSPNQSDEGLLKTMRTTENAVEAIARDSSGTILVTKWRMPTARSSADCSTHSLAMSVSPACGPTVRCVDPTRGRLLCC